MSELSNEPILARIVLSHQEYSRLKLIEEKYYKLQKEFEDFKAGKIEQTGAGISNLQSENDESLEKLAKLVAQKLGQSTSTTTEENVEIVPPSAEFEPIDTVPPTTYGIQITKSDDNTLFDEERLLSLIPKRFHVKAKVLLNEFDNRGNELTWNSSGTLFIKTIAIPNSNFYELFPHLFKKTKTILTGFPELVSQIKQMGLSHNIVVATKPYSNKSMFDSSSSLVRRDQEQHHDKNRTEVKVKNSDKTMLLPWYYIGP